MKYSGKLARSRAGMLGSAHTPQFFRSGIGEHQAEQPETGRPQPGNPRLGAEDAVSDGCRPILQRRLFEIRNAIEVRSHPVAGREHLACNLRVPRLVGLGQGAKTNIAEPDDESEADQEAQCCEPKRSCKTALRAQLDRRSHKKIRRSISGNQSLLHVSTRCELLID
jgi:hypothetical protein